MTVLSVGVVEQRVDGEVAAKRVFFRRAVDVVALDQHLAGRERLGRQRRFGERLANRGGELGVAAVAFGGFGHVRGLQHFLLGVRAHLAAERGHFNRLLCRT